MRWSWCLLLAAACHSNVTIETSGLEGRSALVWILIDNQPPELWGAEIQDGKLAPPPPGAIYKKKLELLAMTFACPLADIGLATGKQMLLDFPDYDEPRTPPPKQMLDLEIEGGEPSEWRPLPEIDPRMRDSLLLLDLPPDNVCSHYTVPYRRIAETRITAPNGSQPVIAEVIDDHRIIVGIASGQLFEIADDGGQREIIDLGLGISPSNLEFRGAYRAPDGQLWLYAADGRVAHGTIDGGFQMLDQVSTATGVEVALAGPGTQSPLELFAVAATETRRTLVRYDGSSWESLYSGFDVPICNLGFFDVLVPPTATWIAPGEAIVHGAGESSGSVLRYREGQAFEETFPPNAGSPASVLQTDLGTFAGTCEGDLVRRADEAWKPAFTKRAETSLPIISMIRSGGGFLYPGGRGRDTTLSAFHPSIGYCDVEDLEGFGRFILRAGRTVFVVYLRDRNQPLKVIVYEEGDPPCFSTEG